MSLFFRGGPYTVPNSYEKSSLRNSWWGLRPLCREEIVQVDAKIQNEEPLDKKKVQKQQETNLGDNKNVIKSENLVLTNPSARSVRQEGD